MGYENVNSSLVSIIAICSLSLTHTQTLDTNHDPRSRNFAHMIGFLASFWVGYGFYKEVLHLNGIRFHWEEEH